MKRRTDAIPCGSVAAEGSFRGAMFGTIWGAVADLDLMESLRHPDLDSQQQQVKSRFIRRINSIGFSGFAFAFFVGVYSVGSCCTERLFKLEKDDPVPAFAGGFLAGGLSVARSRNVATCLQVGLSTGAFSSGVKYFYELS